MLLKEYVENLDQIDQDVINYVLKQKWNDSRISFYKEIRIVVEKEIVDIFGVLIPNYSEVLLDMERIDWKNVDIDFDLFFRSKEFYFIKKSKKHSLFSSFIEKINVWLIYIAFPDFISNLSGVPLYVLKVKKDRDLFTKFLILISILKDF
jgi:hypothetical protein